MKENSPKYIVSVLILLTLLSCKSEDVVADLDYPLIVELSGIVNKNIGNENTQFNAYLSSRTNINGDITDQFFGLNFNAETRYETENKDIVMNRLLMSIESLSGFPAPGNYTISDHRSDSTFIASIRYNEQRRGDSQSNVFTLAYFLESTTGSLKVYKTDNGTFRGEFEIVADLTGGSSSTYTADEPPVREEYSYQASALTLIGEFQID